ncbi:putative membrane protein [Bacteroides fragilis str. S38L3]|nr:putative membrane protein [Bacteroides fragilis str. S38L3]
MEDSFLGMLMVIDMLVIYKVYKLYFCQPKAIMLLFGLECCSILLWLFFFCL